jgi:leucyl-tRNA synthetase
MVEEKTEFAKIEKKWQKKWEEAKLFEAKENSDKKKFYVLEMFPYPSGSGLHMGHAWNYTIGDIFARFKMMQGFNVLHPMGYDAMGLPAENAAIKAGEHPEDYTKKSIKNYIKQQKNLGLSYDWTRMVSTADPEYYKWDQWIFLKMFEKGLAYQKESAVNWCPKCNTVLANEQAQNGKCWRHDNTEVEIKQLKQWFLKITDYANELLEDHKKLDWPQKTIAMQKNWIGKSHGTEIKFTIVPNKIATEKKHKTWPIFTTRPDTIFGVTFMVIAAQHSRLNELVTPEQKKDVDKFLKKIKSVSEKDMEALEKEGVFTGSYAINPTTNEEVPIYAGNFVVADYASGMVMAVPAHDQRDFEFAKKYKIAIKQVIKGKLTDTRAYTESGEMINSGQFDDMPNLEAKEKITEWLKEQKLAKRTINYKLRDWGISRQRYWGPPIPLIHCDRCGTVPVPESDLPVTLPKKVKFGEGNPLETNEDWIYTPCPKCGDRAKREAQTMDTFVNSSWYFLRYCDPHNKKAIFDSKKTKYWMPVDLYIGGAEHACMHLIYSRFYTKFLADLGLISFKEATPRLFHQGMLRAEGGEKMSKSKGNVVLPETVSDKYGIDTARFFFCSLASPDKDIDWSDKGIQGSSRFINKLMSLSDNVEIGEDSEEVLIKLNKTIKNITEQIEKLEYRKSTIALRELFDKILEQDEVSQETLKSAIKLLSPFCPHIAEELWEELGNKDFASIAPWPKLDKSKLKKEETSGDDLNGKIIEQIKPIVEKFPGKNKIYLYVMPFEKEKIDDDVISEAISTKETQKEVIIYATNDKDKIDPENKAKKARPGLVGIYLE